MENQRISVETRAVRITLRTGVQLEGELFLQMHGAHQFGPQRVGEVLNGAEPFIPLRHEGKIDLLNLHQVIAVETPASDEFDELLRLGKEYRVEVHMTAGPALQLATFVSLPDEHNRIKDFLNQGRKFLLFLQDDRVVYLAGKEIVRVID
ncbi:hypothetical protein [Pelobacter seleniigenes]|uniref:hypothetical protein n=1 Tax=Pelobacter seleniigenes TaxID=407188 RepID=UPI0004A70519|nr:hypothetical protein [Pelobacter seleniigenes]